MPKLTIEDLHHILAGERISQVMRATEGDCGFVLITGNNLVLKVEYCDGEGGVSINEQGVEAESKR